jgi:RING finger/CHY zinc finger protein 1
MTANIDCIHYISNCKLLAPCCNKFFSCRHCHDLEMDENETDIKKAHKINRYDIKEMKCNKCETVQETNQYCSNCNECMGLYFCKICNLFDNTLNKFHCDDCKICRIGSRDDLKHCFTCGECFPSGHFDSPCIENSSESTCPFCLDVLKFSTKMHHKMNCGHIVHSDCLNEYLLTNDKCPICCKSINKNQTQIEYIENLINNMPMPDEYKDKEVEIFCNDCLQKSTVKFHFIGNQCSNCKSFNTKI